jgi:putative transposase
MAVFTNDIDRHYYLKMMREYCEKYSLSILTWCLMSNHIHLIAVPAVEDSLAAAIGSAHKGYTASFNKRHEAKGYLFQGRFFSAPLDDPHLYAAVRYVLRNPVRAGMIGNALEYPWSSAPFNAGLVGSDPLVTSNERLSWIRHWNEYLAMDPTEIEEIRRCTRTGRPCGSDDFTAKAEQVTGRTLVKKKPGRKMAPLELKSLR